MLDHDLAELYGVTTKALNQAVKRNRVRFPGDFMFQLNNIEIRAINSLRSQSVTLKRGRHLKYAPYAFTEHGAVMLANVLRSRRAVRASIQVVRAFVHLRQMLATNARIARKIDTLERRVGKHDLELQNILVMIRKLLEHPPFLQKRPMGFSADRKS